MNTTILGIQRALRMYSIAAPTTPTQVVVCHANLSSAVTSTWALPFTAYMLLLQGRVTNTRIKNEHYFGDHLSTDKPSGKEHSKPDPLHLASRAHQNFIENVPYALILAAAAEINGGSRKVINYSLAALLVLRIMHVEIGLYGKDTVGPGRPIAFFGTQAWMAAMAGYGAYLVKGYWNL
jgi:uncharacterized membrane protein YecN with MAPEG domain